ALRREGSVTVPGSLAERRPAAPTTADQATSGAPNPDVEMIGVTKRFGPVVAVDRMDLAIPGGSFTSLLGPSGCGKTTTLRMIAGFEQPTEGEILLAGRPIAGVPPYHRNVNTVFQHYALFPHMDVAQNVGYGLRQRKVGRAEEQRRVDEALDLVRLTGYGKRRTWELSGGQQQRVALARALINHPTVLLLDEPLGALDLKLRKEMQLELKALQQEVGITFVYVTHDQEEALTMSEMIVVMRDGVIQQRGAPDELYERPSNAFVANFIGVSNFITGKLVSHDRGTDRAVVETDGGLRLVGHVTDVAAEPAAGVAVTVAVRPERLRVEEAGEVASTDGWTAIRGRIRQGTYLGDQTEYRITTDQVGELVARRQNASGASTGLGPGDPVVVRWHEEANLILVG
ncbi:MAG TPA: ABC transporter ATP-binding protein, partial [Candidatus Limnocylindrales bacterium]|nr:ABC transporter ATP-binding protein [Candidatus Limnocylindrales bacterium]